MGLFQEIAKFFGNAGSQLTPTQNFWKYEADKKVIRFGNKIYEACKQYRISQKDALDVYITDL